MLKAKNRILVTGAVVLAALAIALPQSAASWPSRKKSPPPPPPVPPMAMGASLINDAASYKTYMERVSKTNPQFTQGADVATALRSASSFNAQGLVRGAIAYGAIAALQDKAFVEALRPYARDSAARKSMAARLRADPGYAVVFNGADSAAGLAREAIAGQATELGLAGVTVKKAAYEIQRQSWSKAEVADRPGRLLAVKVASDTGMSPAPEQVARLQASWNGATPLGLTGAPASRPYSRLVDQSLGLAALVALGEAGDENLGLNVSLLSETATQSCLNLSKINLNQCLSVAKPYYEDVFCLGQHVLIDTGVCMVRGSGAPVPTDMLAPKLVQHASTTVRPYVTPAKKKVVKKPVKK